MMGGCVRVTAGQCFNCLAVPNCLLLWLAGLVNGLLNMCCCTCMFLTCKPRKAVGRLLSPPNVDPLKGSEVRRTLAWHFYPGL